MKERYGVFKFRPDEKPELIECFDSEAQAASMAMHGYNLFAIDFESRDGIYPIKKPQVSSWSRRK
ncbi:MAG: hypothetical protein ACUZ8H_10325 [Candidatus Anammoxibacter sp.]